MTTIISAASSVRAKIIVLWRRLFRKPGWVGEPVDAAHAYYRTQYERLVETLPGLPRRSKDHTVNETFLAFSQVVHELHDLGDDPIMPPGVRRIVVRERGARLAQFGAIGAPSGLAGFLLSLGPLLPYIVGGVLLLSVTGLGTSLWNGWRADRLEDRAERAETRLEETQVALATAAAERDANKGALEIARAGATQTAATIEQERALRVRAQREARRIRDAQAAAVAGGNIDYGFGSVRDDGPLSPAPGGGAGPGPGHP